MLQDRIIIVGGGIGGLVAAAVLSRYAPVTLLERSDRFGGKVRQASIGSSRIDCGPTVFTLKDIFDEVFAACGEHLPDHLSLQRQDILARHFWPDGAALDLHGSPEESADAISRFAGPDEADRYRKFLSQARDTWETLYGPFIRQPKPSFPGLIVRAGVRRLSKMNPYTRYSALLGRTFRDPRLRQLFGRYATYSGCSPYQAPATLMLIAHIEQKGVFGIEGGMFRLVEALVEIAGRNGADMRLGCDVAKIDPPRGAGAQGGVETAEGQYLTARQILYNGDSSHLKSGGAGRSCARAVGGGPHTGRSQSAMTFSFTASAEGPPLGLHNVFFSRDYPAEFRDVFKRGRIPLNPTLYIFAPDAMESPDRAHAGSGRYFCLVNAPANGDSHHYTEEDIDRCQTRAFQHLRACGLKLLPTPGEMETSTPTDFAARYPGTGGALFGKAIHGWRASFLRQGIRTRAPGFYCAGGSVHPGSGVPMAALSGLMAARMILQDRGSPAPSPREDMRGGMSTRSAMMADMA